MKAFLLFALMSISFLSAVAQSIVTKAGLTVKANYSYIVEDRLMYPTKLQNNHDYILFSEIDTIRGLITSELKKYIQESNGSIIFIDNDVKWAGEKVESPKPKAIIAERYENPSVNYQKTALCLRNAGTNYLVGSGLSIGGAAMMAFGKDDVQILGGAVSIAGLIVNIIGHTNLIKAGWFMERDRKLILNNSTAGLGLAYKF